MWVNDRNSQSSLETQKGIWGRNVKVSFLNKLLCLLLFSVTPGLVFYYINTAMYCNYDIFDGVSCLLSGDLSLTNEVEQFKDFLRAINIVVVWLTLQFLLALLPDVIHKCYSSYHGGRKEGLITPGGYIYEYNINGLQAWLISVTLFIIGSYCGVLSPTIIYDYWGNILLVGAVLAYVLTTIAYIKAHVFPTNQRDCKFSNSKFYDYFMGVELNPRIGPLDWKLFFNGRPGIIGWSLINLSFAAAQFTYHGHISNSMILVNFLQTLYIGYFFYREAWYLKTLDISHDHFGWMFSFGDLVWLPAMYTLQALYLVENPVDLSFPYFLFVLSLGCCGFYIFASSNNEKDNFRSNHRNDMIDRKQLRDLSYTSCGRGKDSMHRNAGSLPQLRTIPCTYHTSDGKTHQTQLLMSGWWGTCRHINYTGDLMLSLAYSLACGTNSIFPYFYIIYLTILLLHRSIRDDTKCRDKYGSSWDTYCQHVPYRFIPGII
jgi:7-dehydrocholesterol reductase